MSIQLASTLLEKQIDTFMAQLHESPAPVQYATVRTMLRAMLEENADFRSPTNLYGQVAREIGTTASSVSNILTYYRTLVSSTGTGFYREHLLRHSATNFSFYWHTLHLLREHLHIHEPSL